MPWKCPARLRAYASAQFVRIVNPSTAGRAPSDPLACSVASMARHTHPPIPPAASPNSATVTASGRSTDGNSFHVAIPTTAPAPNPRTAPGPDAETAPPITAPAATSPQLQRSRNGCTARRAAPPTAAPIPPATRAFLDTRRVHGAECRSAHGSEESAADRRRADAGRARVGTGTWDQRSHRPQHRARVGAQSRTADRCPCRPIGGSCPSPGPAGRRHRWKREAGRSRLHS